MAQNQNLPVAGNKGYKGIINYVYDNRDKTVEELPINVLDHAVLAYLTYVPFEEFTKYNRSFEPLSLEELLQNYLLWIDMDRMMVYLPEWLRASIYLSMSMIKTNRYHDVKVLLFGYDFDEAERVQFAALAFEMPDGSIIVSYRGTDNSFNGWKEDLDMAISDSVKGQLLAKSFLSRTMKLYPEKNVTITGHSKGANFAVYAASTMSAKYDERLKRVYSFDGPGLSDAIFYSEGRMKVKDRIQHYVTQDDLIGILLNHEDIHMVVESALKDDPVMQHDIFRWKIRGTNFKSVKDRTPLSYFLEATMSEWLSQIPIEDRKTTINSLFKILDFMGVTTPDALALNLQRFGTQFVLNMYRLQRSERKLMVGQFRSLLAIAGKHYPRYLMKTIPEKEKPKVKEKPKKFPKPEAKLAIEGEKK